MDAQAVCEATDKRQRWSRLRPVKDLSEKPVDTVSNGRGDRRVAVLGTDPHLLAACASAGLVGVVIRDVQGHLRGGPLPAGFVEAVVDELTDVGAVLGALRRVGGGPEAKVDVVMTMHEQAVSTASAVGAVLGAKAIPATTAILMRDKEAQKDAVRRAGIPTADARFCIAGSPELQTPFPGPCVVKPLNGAASARTYKCRTAEEYADVLRRAAGWATTLVVEDLVEAAEEWMYDGVMSDGAVAFGSLARYAEPLLDMLNSGTGGERRVISTHRLNDAVDPQACADARAVAQAALSALGHTDGAFHLELLREAETGRFFFGECAGRRGGAMIEEEVLVKYGYSITAGAVDAMLGRLPSQVPQECEDWVGMTYIYLSAGTLIEVAAPEDLLKLPFVHAVHISALLGPIRPPSDMHSAYRQAMAVVSGETLDELEQNMAKTRESFARLCVVAPTDGPRAQLEMFTRERQERRRAAAANEGGEHQARAR